VAVQIAVNHGGMVDAGNKELVNCLLRELVNCLLRHGADPNISNKVMEYINGIFDNTNKYIYNRRVQLHYIWQR
jgi:hypothetical protein